MRIVIDPRAADDPDAHRWLDRILGRIEDGWHVWDLSESDPDDFWSTMWLDDRGAQGDRVRELLVASAQRGAWTPTPHGRRVRVTPCPDGTDDLAPEPAFRLADEPFVILVENRSSDGAFVECVVKEFDTSLRVLWDRPGKPIWIDSLGGTGQMRQEVEARTDRVPYRPRLVAVIDSDRKGPGDTESHEARNLHRVCEERGLSCWVLAKREAENYLPRILLGARPRPNAGDRHDRLLEAWDRLDDDQKDFFDMKRGLSDDPSDVEQALFDGLSDADREILADGFGRNVNECWKQRQVREVKDELLARGRGDLERGIALIRKEV